MNLTKIFLLPTLILLYCNTLSYAQVDNTIKTVVIDPGHGGKDVGAIGKTGLEKDLVLDIALRLGNYIEKNIPGVKVIYTRKTDVFIELHKRAEIANKNDADLFISIHANSSDNPRPHGTETYIMGLDKAAKNLDIVKKENSVILQEDNYQEAYGDFNPNSPEAYIIFSLYQNVYLKQSLRLAQLVQNQFRERVHRKDRGVKGAPFWVLWDSKSPSVLIELGFISNLKESRFLFSEQGKDYMASAIYRAFKEYKIEMDGPLETQISETPKETEKTNKVKNTKKNKDIVFKVQFMISPTKIPLTSKKFKGLKDVEEHPWRKTKYKYTSGSETDLDKIVEHQRKVRKLYPDAFVIAFYKGKKISFKEALKKIKE